MKINTFGYFFKEAFKSLARNRWMALASMSTVAISLMILGGALIWVFNTNSLVQTIESNLEIVVFLKNEVNEQQAVTIGRRIEVMDTVTENRLVTKEEAMEMFRKRFEQRKNLLNALEGRNPLPNMFKVKVKDPEYVTSTAEAIQQLPGVEQVQYGQGWVEKVITLTQWVRYIGFGVMGLIAAAAIFLISTTIRLTVFARRKEIQIMRYVGATSAFIRWPFLIEGLFLGILGALLATLVLFGGYLTFANIVPVTFFPLRTDIPFLLTISEVLIGSGILIGVLGSVISVHRFLRA